MDQKKNQKLRPFLVGLTGGIACGKSSIASLFASLGVPIIDADAIARKVVEKGSPLLEKLREKFGSQVIAADGALDRAALKKIVFDSEHRDRLETLNTLMAPAIRELMTHEVLNTQASYVIVMIPLLFEQHYETFVDRVLVVDVTEEMQLKRVMLRDNIDEKLARSIIANQINRVTRIKKADDLIQSDNSPLTKKLDVVIELHHKYQRLSADFRKLKD